jgi:hypothetical protein
MSSIIGIGGEKHVPPKDWHEATHRALAAVRCPHDGAPALLHTYNVEEDVVACSECARTLHVGDFRHVTEAELNRRKHEAEKLRAAAERGRDHK